MTGFGLCGWESQNLLQNLQDERMSIRSIDPTIIIIQLLSSINSWNDITWSRISSESGCWEQKRHSSSRRGLNYFDPDLIEIHAPPSPSRSQRPCQRLSEAGDSFFRWEGRWRRTMRTIGRNCPTNTSRDDSVSLDDDAAITTKDALSLD